MAQQVMRLKWRAGPLAKQSVKTLKNMIKKILLIHLFGSMLSHAAPFKVNLPDGLYRISPEKREHWSKVETPKKQIELDIFSQPITTGNFTLDVSNDEKLECNFIVYIDASKDDEKVWMVLNGNVTNLKRGKIGNRSYFQTSFTEFDTLKVIMKLLGGAVDPKFKIERKEGQ